MTSPLLTTKLYIPPTRSSLVPRPRLIAKLNAGLTTKLTLISAPAGFGKTTLVAEFINNSQFTIPNSQFAWFSLDESDNDPTRFLAYLIAALQKVESGIGDTTLALLHSPQRPPPETLLTPLINELAATSPRFILVLDDYHAIQNTAVHQQIAFILENQPPQLHLVIVTRADPPLPLARLRVRGEMNEIRINDLRFTTDEAAAFLNSTAGLNLSPEDVAVLEERTEGWIAGLQMAALSMQGRKECSSVIEAFSGSHHFIMDYLVAEILEQQSHDVQAFLLKTSILKRMTAALCDTMTDGNDSQTILTGLEQANLFLVPLDEDRRWYRYHHLFADLLQSILKQRTSAAEVCELHRRAGQWHQANGSLEEAMIHTMAAQDFERAAEIIEENFTTMFSRSEVPILLSWIEKLPAEIRHNHPWIDVYRANTLALASQLDGVEPLLEGVEKRIAADAPQSQALLGHIAAIRAYTANLRGDAAHAIEMAALAERHLPEDRSTARAMAAYALMDTVYAGDDMEKAGRILLDMIRTGQDAGRLMLIVPALCDLASVKKVQGRLHQAKELYDRAYQWMKKRKGLDSRVRCSYEFGLADLLREWNQLDAACEHAMTGNAYRQRLGGYLVVGDITLMRILQAQGDVEDAMKSLHNAEKHMQTYPFQLAVTTEFKTARVMQWLAMGNVEMASRWAEACDSGSELEQIALARLQLAQGRAADAERLLAQQRALAERGGRNGRLIEILVLQAIALKEQGQTDAAAATLFQALFLARPEGYRRVFLDMGRPLYELLAQSTEQNRSATITPIANDYVHDLLDAFQQTLGAASLPPSLTETLVDPLTEREQDVLRLLVEGLSNKEIAARLVVAPSTVKQHLKNIYGKLDVHSRTQAASRGRELNLL